MLRLGRGQRTDIVGDRHLVVVQDLMRRAGPAIARLVPEAFPKASPPVRAVSDDREHMVSFHANRAIAMPSRETDVEECPTPK